MHHTIDASWRFRESPGLARRLTPWYKSNTYLPLQDLGGQLLIRAQLLLVPADAIKAGHLHKFTGKQILCCQLQHGLGSERVVLSIQPVFRCAPFQHSPQSGQWDPPVRFPELASGQRPLSLVRCLTTLGESPLSAQTLTRSFRISPTTSTTTKSTPSWPLKLQGSVSSIPLDVDWRPFDSRTVPSS